MWIEKSIQNCRNFYIASIILYMHSYKPIITGFQVRSLPFFQCVRANRSREHRENKKTASDIPLLSFWESIQSSSSNKRRSHPEIIRKRNIYFFFYTAFEKKKRVLTTKLSILSDSG